MRPMKDYKQLKIKIILLCGCPRIFIQKQIKIMESRVTYRCQFTF